MSIYSINSAQNYSSSSKANNVSFDQSQLQSFGRTPNNVQDAIFEHSHSDNFGYNGFIPLSLNTGWTNFGAFTSYKNYGTAGYYKIGRTVSVRGVVKKSTSGILDEVITQLPPSCSPNTAMISPSWAWDGTNPVSPCFTTYGNDGTIRYGNGDGRGFISLLNTYLIDQPTYLWIGDNIGVGYGIDPSQRFSKLVSNNKGVKEDNLCVSGTSMQSTINSNPTYPNTPAVVDNLFQYLTRFPEIIFIQAGTNDICFDDPNFNSTNYQLALDYAVSYFIDNGVRPRNIYILTPPYHPVSGYSFGSIFTSGSVSKHLDYIQSGKLVAKHKCCGWIDTYTPLQNAGDSYFLDNINPNPLGHQIIANTIINALASSSVTYSF